MSIPMAFCSGCRSEVGSEDRFCKKCGSRLAAKLTAAPHEPRDEFMYKVGRFVGSISARSGLPMPIVGMGLILLVGLLVVALYFDSRGGQNTPERRQAQASSSAGVESAVPSPQSSFSMKETIRVGYWSYVVWDIKWQRSIDSGYSRKQADANFLLLNVTVRNNDNTGSILPPFKLVDSEGREYDESSDAIYLPGSFGLLKKLNPGVRSDGYIVFDVPEGIYKLKVSGGFKSGRTALVSLY